MHGLAIGILTLMKELCEYCLDDRRDTMDVAVGNRRCTETSPTPNLFKPIHISDKGYNAEAQKPSQRIGIADWKVFACRSKKFAWKGP